MIEIIQDLPSNVAGFIAKGKVTHSDYKNTISPKVKSVSEDSRKISYLLVIETGLKNYTLRAWIDDALLGLKYFTRWGRIAIVSSRRNIRKFTDTFGVFVPGKAKGFMSEEINSAREWVSSG